MAGRHGDRREGRNRGCVGEDGTAPPLRFHIGGQARFLDSLIGLIDLDPDEKVAKTIRIDIRIDDQYRYYD